MLPSAESQYVLITEVLQTGPADGRLLLDHIQNTTENVDSKIWIYLLEASRSSEHALTWREAFGRQRESHAKPNSVLELAIEHLRMLLSRSNLHSIHPTLRETSTLDLARLIANCCADNDHNRRVTIRAGAIECLMAALGEGMNPNILIPAIYNVCIDIKDPSEIILSQPNSVQVTIAEERLAVCDSNFANVFSGLQRLLKTSVIQGCATEIREYLADLIIMAATPIAALEANFLKEADPVFHHILIRLCSSDVSQLLADHSIRCRVCIIQTTLALCHLQAAKTALAATGNILPLALIADQGYQSDEYFGEDNEEQQENMKVLEDLKTSMIKLMYEVCQLPQFTKPPKYGIARQSIEIVHHQDAMSSDIYKYAVALLMLYGFVDCDARANVLIAENNDLIGMLLTAMISNDKTIVHLALALASKLAVTWNLRSKLCEAGALTAIDHLVTSPDLGHEIPLNAITFLELLIKGQPNHVEAMAQPLARNGRSVLDDVLLLFGRGQDAISFEIGRLVLEIISTLAPAIHSIQQADDLDLYSFFDRCDKQAIVKTIIFMGTKGQMIDEANAQRVWYALGLLCLSSKGREITRVALGDPELYERMNHEMSSTVDTPVKRNILSMKWTLEQGSHSNEPASHLEDLDNAISRMRLE